MLQAFPTRRVVYHTHLSAEQVYKRIMAITMPAQLFADVEEGKVYEGSVTPKAFSLQKITTRNESWKPKIEGLIIDEGEYTYVEITCSLSILSYILNAVFYLSPIAILFLYLLNGSINNELLFTPIGAVFLFLFSNLSLYTDVRDLKIHFNKLLETQALSIKR